MTCVGIWDCLNAYAPLIQAISTVVLVGVTVFYVRKTGELADESKKQTEIIERSHLQPVMVFYRLGDPLWRLKNVGNGPAINVLVTGGKTPQSWNQNTSGLFSAIAPGQELLLNWIKTPTDTRKLCAIYGDVAGRKYTSVCAENLNEVDEGNKYPSLKPKYYQFQLERKYGPLSPRT